MSHKTPIASCTGLTRKTTSRLRAPTSLCCAFVARSLTFGTCKRSLRRLMLTNVLKLTKSNKNRISADSSERVRNVEGVMVAFGNIRQEMINPTLLRAGYIPYT